MKSVFKSSRHAVNNFRLTGKVVVWMMDTVRTVLLGDDNGDDVFFVRYAFEAAGLPGTLRVVRDGDEVIEYLLGRGEYADRKRFPEPHLLLLDLKMPGRNGFEVLTWLKRRPIKQQLPVVVLSSSGLEVDVKRAKALGAADYHRKVCGLEETARMLVQIWERWLNWPGGGFSEDDELAAAMEEA